MANKLTPTEQAIADREKRTREANKDRAVARRPRSKAAEAADKKAEKS